MLITEASLSYVKTLSNPKPFFTSHVTFGSNIVL